MDSISVAGKLVKLSRVGKLISTRSNEFCQVQLTSLNELVPEWHSPLVANQIPASHQLSEEVSEGCDFSDL